MSSVRALCGAAFNAYRFLLAPAALLIGFLHAHVAANCALSKPRTTRLATSLRCRSSFAQKPRFCASIRSKEKDLSFRAQPRNLTIKCGRRNAGRNELKTPRVRLMRRQSAAIHLPSPFVGHSVPGFLHVGRNDKRGELLSAISFALSCSYAPRAQVSPAPSGWRVPAAVRLRAAPAAIRLRAAEVFAPVLRPKARSALLICS